MQAMTELVSENLKITKTNVSQPPQPVPTQDLEVVSEIKAAVDRIDASVKSKQNRSKLRKDVVMPLSMVWLRIPPLSKS